MIYEFEGKTEREAMELATQELGLDTSSFDVEIIENQSGGLFKKGKVRIRVHTKEATSEDNREKESNEHNKFGEREEARDERHIEPLPMEDFENKIIEWTSEVISLMGYSAQVSVAFREPNKLGLRIDTEAASILIGKKGRNIDSLQLLANVYAGNLGHSDTKIVLDSENYRLRREEALVRVAYKTAEEVRSTGHSILLEPMNPFERRIIHTTLNDIVDIETKSEGDGLMKQVRVMLKGRN
ncbi:MAG TPA: RNA-binding cell elongation regulator Jag/EloR [Rectinema sp.]|jgi:spoIIIJ-associated protein|nr:protein jag [Spirochaetia bacterium]MDI9427701.1 RNA-binding cell elongation regulator Jag/EloR [Spirochaetota bacterium]NLH90032.1 protein jag [Treponema sp.]OQC75241.1 MAG: R3H domain protein [Spirochaetes bacterium ADurb.Bin001]HNP93144.1 RNA-binding cell elongation regulator Jag/EloR [Rectinema sp.]